jgi:hypothetical protein
LINERRISIDIMGLHQEHGIVAIELKYVTAAHCKNCKSDYIKPSNEPAFSYDIAKDCLKIELLMADRARLRPRSQIPSSFAQYMRKREGRAVTGYVLGLTNWPECWSANGQQQPHDWARHFRAQIYQERVCLRGTTRSAGSNPKNTIYGKGGKRCHISLAMPWSGEWRQYRTWPDECLQFRYLLLAPGWTDKSEYSHDPSASDTIPFLDSAAKDAYRSIAREVHRAG